MIVEVENANKTIKGTPVLSGINLTLEGGRVYGLQGKNGSGKTMLLRLLAGLIRPTEGNISIDGRRLPPGEFPPSIGIMIENPTFVQKYTGLKNLKYLAGIRDEITTQDIEDSMLSVGLDPQDRRPFKKYSLGMKQRLGIACAVMENPALILLDEPFNALDSSGLKMARHIILSRKAAGSIVVLACHDREELSAVSDEIVEIFEGKIISHEKLGAAR